MDAPVPKKPRVPVKSDLSGLELITIERNEQLTKHGISIQKDVDTNKAKELGKSAVAILTENKSYYPLNWADKFYRKTIAEKSYKERLVIAGALICAEIDRINAEEKNAPKPKAEPRA